MDEDFIDVVSNSAESFKMVSQQQQARRDSSGSLDRLGMREAGSAFQPVFPSRGASSR